jgi:hypothetical protein
MMMENIKQILSENGRTISNKDRGLASMMDNEPRMQDRSAEGQMFSLESEIKNLMKEYEIAVRDGDNERAQRIADIINELDAQKIGISGGMADKMIASQKMAEGGEAQMPDMSEQEAMAELEAAGPDFEIVEQLIGAVVQMIQQGVSEAEVKEFLKEQGLDEEDIQELFEMVMERLQQASIEEPIGRELQGMM